MAFDRKHYKLSLTYSMVHAILRMVDRAELSRSDEPWATFERFREEESNKRFWRGRSKKNFEIHGKYLRKLCKLLSGASFGSGRYVHMEHKTSKAIRDRLKKMSDVLQPIKVLPYPNPIPERKQRLVSNSTAIYRWGKFWEPGELVGFECQQGKGLIAGKADHCKFGVYRIDLMDGKSTWIRARLLQEETNSMIMLATAAG